MFNIGDLIVYNSTGVCKIEDIRKIKDVKGVKSKQDYYIIQPLYQNGTIFTPVDTKIFMRPLLTKEETLKLIDSIPGVDCEACFNKTTQQLVEHYTSAFRTHDCNDLIELIKSIYMKKKYVEEHKRKFGQVDERYMKRAEDLLYGEFSIVLGIEKDDVHDFIRKRLEPFAMAL